MRDVDQALWKELFPISPVFTARQVRERTDVHPKSVYRRLKRLADDGVLVRVRRGLWAMPEHPDFSPYAVVPHLFTEEESGYVSLLSALHLHELIEQIPQVVQIVTTRQREDLSTPVADYEFHQIQEELFGGYAPYDRQWSFQIARPEKALFDTCYFSTRKGKRFSRLPEVTLTRDFDRGAFDRWIRKIPDDRHCSAVRDRASEIFQASRRAT